MKKNLTCIECPKGCSLLVEIEGAKVKRVSGNKCPKGEKYACVEIEHPMRVLTSTLTASGLSIKMVPVKTDRPIPKVKIKEAADELKKLKVARPLKTGEIICKNFLGLGVNVVSCREALIKPGLEL
jgi:CxxC motif-containing protein